MTLYCHASLNTISNCSLSATGLCAQPRSWHMGGALCRRCDNYLGSGRWRCFSKVRCLSAASSDFWKTLLADSRQPRSQPPTKPGANRHPSPRRPASAIRHPPSTTKKSAPQPIQPAKNALLISISLQSYTITYDQHTIPYDRIKYNS